MGRAVIGDLQAAILERLDRLGLATFRIADLRALGIPRGNLWRSVACLERRGIVARVGRGVYRLRVDPRYVLERSTVARRSPRLARARAAATS